MVTDMTSADLSFRHGLPAITVTLPSRNEPVSFTCPPVTGTIGDLLREIKEEDRGVDHAAVFAQVHTLALIECSINNAYTGQCATRLGHYHQSIIDDGRLSIAYQ